MYSLELSLRYSPFPLSIQKKEFEDVKKIKENLSSTINLELIDKYKIDGDFIESQAFAFLAVRSVMKLPISFPNTTGCRKPSYGGKIIKN